jgi:hypothetical protein
LKKGPGSALLPQKESANPEYWLASSCLALARFRYGLCPSTDTQGRCNICFILSVLFD